MIMKKLFFLSVMAVVCVNTLNTQWVCDVTYWGDKYTYNTANGGRAYLRVEEYYESLARDNRNYGKFINRRK